MIQPNTETANSSFIKKAYNPLMLGGMVFGTSAIIMLVSMLINSADIAAVSPGFYWQITATFMLFYAVFNSIFSLSTNDMNKYWMQSMLTFVGLVAGLALVAYLCSGQSIGEAGPYKWIFIVLTFGYLVFLSIVNLLKTIVNYAEKEDWQAPKQRKRKK